MCWNTLCNFWRACDRFSRTEDRAKVKVVLHQTFNFYLFMYLFFYLLICLSIYFFFESCFKQYKLEILQRLKRFIMHHWNGFPADPYCTFIPNFRWETKGVHWLCLWQTSDANRCSLPPRKMNGKPWKRRRKTETVRPWAPIDMESVHLIFFLFSFSFCNQRKWSVLSGFSFIDSPCGATDKLKTLSCTFGWTHCDVVTISATFVRYKPQLRWQYIWLSSCESNKKKSKKVKTGEKFCTTQAALVIIGHPFSLGFFM